MRSPTIIRRLETAVAVWHYGTTDYDVVYREHGTAVWRHYDPTDDSIEAPGCPVLRSALHRLFNSALQDYTTEAVCITGRPTTKTTKAH